MTGIQVLGPVYCPVHSVESAGTVVQVKILLHVPDGRQDSPVLVHPP